MYNNNIVCCCNTRTFNFLSNILKKWNLRLAFQQRNQLISREWVSIFLYLLFVHGSQPWKPPVLERGFKNCNFLWRLYWIRWPILRIWDAQKDGYQTIIENWEYKYVVVCSRTFRMYIFITWKLARMLFCSRLTT